MNRPIKFRAWDKQGKRMMVVPNLNFGNDGAGKTTTIEYKSEQGFDIGLVAGESGELMQFTGFLDKNGKEIYEGDVVSFHGHPHPVIYNKEKGRFGWTKSGWSFTRKVLLVLAVVGNIYENPSLLPDSTQ